MFFRNADFFAYRDRIKAAGIETPVVAGLMPLSQLKPGQTDFFGASIPDELQTRIAKVRGDAEASRRVGAQWCFDQICELIDAGVEGIHLYIMNRSNAALEIMDRLRESYPGLADSHGVNVSKMS
jgi:methylenetetrahydrofolate reductase (NADPH)